MAAFHPFLPLDRGQFLADLLRDLPGEDCPVRLACAGPAMRPFSTRETEARLVGPGSRNAVSIDSAPVVWSSLST